MNKENLPSLEPNAIDGIAAVIRAITSLMPGDGFLNELILPHIKNQWQDRMNKFAMILCEELSSIPVDKLQKLIEHPTVMNIIEEGTLNAMKLYSEKRKAEIAKLIANSLKEDKVHEEATISLIQTLSILNDTEVILLISKSNYADQDFFKTNETLLRSNLIHSDTTDEQYLSALMYPKYIGHLMELHLLKPEYEKQPSEPPNLRNPKKWDPTRVTGHRITGIGNRLVELILGTT